MTQIKFGTSGWRALLAEEFTFHNARVLIEAIAEYVKSEGLAHHGVLVGSDPRFLNEEFTKQAACVLAANGVPVVLSDNPVPTPVLSFETIRRKAAGIVNFTASHNPARYNGIKFSPADGGPAVPEITNAIAEIANRKLAAGVEPKIMDFEQACEQKLISVESLFDPYVERINKIVDFEVITKSGLRVVYDAMSGAGIGYLDQILEGFGVEVLALNSTRDPYFGGHSPDPVDENLTEMVELVKSGRYDIGLATDGDADRFGIVDRDGRFITPNEVIALLYVHLRETRGWEGGVARSVATTHLIDLLAEKRGDTVYKTPVGFKYIGQLINQDKIVIGGEESGGLSIKGHVPEKDGVLACLLMLELAAHSGKSFGVLLDELHQEVGYITTRRDNLHLSVAQKEQVLAALNKDTFETVCGKKIISTDFQDGFLYELSDRSWFLIRPSGTEPVLRIYFESRTDAGLGEMAAEIRAFVDRF